MEIDTLTLEKKLSDLRRNFSLLLSFDAFAELRKATVNFVTSACASVCPHETSLLPLDGILQNLTVYLIYSRKSLEKNQVFINIKQQ